MATAGESGAGSASGENEQPRTKSEERKAARKLRKAEDVAREAPLTIQTPEEREAKRQGRAREKRQGGGGGDLTPDELELRRLYAGRIREVRAAAGGGTPDPSGAITVSAEEMQLRREYGARLRELRGEGAVTVTAPSLVASGVATTQAPAAIDVGAAPQEQGSAAPQQGRTDAKYRAVIAKRAAKTASAQAAAPPLPETWRPPVPSRVGNVPSLMSSEAVPLAAPVLRVRVPSPQDRFAEWLGPRPGVRGALAGLTLLLFWELCRLWGGDEPAPVELFGDFMVAALVALLAWRLFLRQEMRDA